MSHEEILIAELATQILQSLYSIGDKNGYTYSDYKIRAVKDAKYIVKEAQKHE